jgi:hypothetical protein
VRVLSGNRAPTRTADRDQAGYFFHELLGRKRADLDARIDQLHIELTTLDPVHDGHAVRSKRRIIRALESEAYSIDRMLKALRNRLSEQLPHGA